MIDAVAPGRLRPVCAVAVVAGILLSLLALCCCVDVDPPALPGGGDTAGVASVHVAQDGVTDTAGHDDPDCAQAPASDAAMPASADTVVAVANPVARAAVEATPDTGPAPDARLRPPVPYLLCVMRT